jgi:hypothetical protein
MPCSKKKDFICNHAASQLQFLPELLPKSSTKLEGKVLKKIHGLMTFFNPKLLRLWRIKEYTDLISFVLEL